VVAHDGRTFHHFSVEYNNKRTSFRFLGFLISILRALQLGDPGGHICRALASFPEPTFTQRFLDRYFVEGGKAADTAFRPVPMSSVLPSLISLEFCILSTFVTVWLAREGHNGCVGINLLEKSRISTMPSLYGAMLAGVDYVLMGAGIPRQFTGRAMLSIPPLS
jgi:NAD(P)H-dependent flavin oxidoreductase YrpB (nitropropane dioxygenase family)